MRENPSLVFSVYGLQDSTERIGIDSLRAQYVMDKIKAIRELMLFLQSYGISPTYAQKVFKTYGEESKKIVQENPYQLARDVYGIGFKTADHTAQKLGIDRQADIRIDSVFSESSLFGRHSHRRSSLPFDGHPAN